MKKQSLGKLGEQLAQNFLQKEHGHQIITKNYFTIYGEIDIISEKEQTLFFVEVKTRSNNLYGKGFEAVTFRKIQNIRKSAEKYLVHHEWTGKIQFLVISITYIPPYVDYELLELF